MARGRSTQDCFQGQREALGGTEAHHSLWQCKESHRCCCHGPLAPLRFWTLRQNERTIVRYPVQHKRWTYPCYRAVYTELQRRWTRKRGATILKVHKCCTPVNKAMSEISNCCHYFYPTLVFICFLVYGNYLSVIISICGMGSDCHSLPFWPEILNY